MSGDRSRGSKVAAGERMNQSACPRIVAFTKDWDDVPTCTTHVLRQMARTMPVLWVESIGTRKPRLAAGRDLRRAFRKVLRGLAGAVLKENRLKVLSPLVIPKTESAAGRWLNRRLMRWLVGRELRAMGGPSTRPGTGGPVEYWCFVPNAVDLLPDRRGPGQTPRPRIVYYCVDDWAKFHNLDGGWLSRKEEEVLRIADVVFTPARYLEEKCRRSAGDKVHYTPHGVDFAAFSAALRSETRVPSDVAALPKPVVGFYGNIHPWIDFGLIERLAAVRPRWSFVLIGGVFCDVSRLSGQRNVHFPGRREHTTLPSYCKAFDAGFIPYDMTNPRMESVNPVKTKELLAAGVPIVAPDMPELLGYGDRVRICHSTEEWLGALEAQIVRTDRAAISASVAGEDWSVKVAAIRQIVDRA